MLPFLLTLAGAASVVLLLRKDSFALGLASLMAIAYLTQELS